jgi:uncharacterized protein YkwD
MFRNVRIRLIILLVAIVLISACLIVVIVSRPSTKQSTHNVSVPQTISISATDIFNLVNQQRVNAGLKPLIMNAELNQSAVAKCNDEATNGYYAHVSPTGVTWQSFFQSAGYPVSTSYIGENLAESNGESDSQIVAAWMASPGHRANILNVNYTQGAVATCSSSPFVLIVQHFGGL